MNKPWNKGIKTGIVPKTAFKKGHESWLKGKHLSEKMKKHLSEINMGKGNPSYGLKRSEETKIKMSLSNRGVSRGKGRKLTEEHKRKISKSKSGVNCNFWKGGVTKWRAKIYNSLEYKLWRKAVFERDNYTCVWCGKRGGNGEKVVLNADHIKPFSLFPELRFAIDNGRTLCIDCHKKTDTYSYKANKYFIK